MKMIRSARLIAGETLLAGLLAACASGAGVPVVTPQPQASQSVPSASVEPTDETIELKVYFLMHDPRGIEFLAPVQRSIPQAEDVAEAAIRELLAGPTAVERSGVYPGRHGQLPPLSTAVPRDTKMLGIEIRNGIATVDLSGDFGSGDEVGSHVYRQAQITYTLTQFQWVDGVSFRINGEPMPVIEGHEGTASTGPATRDLYFDQRRAVFVDEPAWSAPVGGSVLVTGETTSDAGLRIALIDGTTDTILAERTVQASCPCIAPAPWGPFGARLSMPAGPRPSDLRLRIWEPPYSEDGPTTVIDYLLGVSSASPTSPAAEPSAADLAPFECVLPASLPATTDRAQIADVRVARHGVGASGYDRIVFEFEGTGIPQVTLRAGTPPFTQDPSDLPLPVRGTSFLELVLHGATRVTAEGTITYSGPTDFTPGFPALTEFTEAGDFEAVSQWVAGLAGPSCHRVSVLENPTRLVIDLQHPQG